MDTSTVVLSSNDAVFGQGWEITGGFAARVARPRGRPRGLRHRSPLHVTGVEQEPLCTVRRSRALKGHVRSFDIIGPDGASLGSVTRRFGRLGEERSELRSGDGLLLGQLVGIGQPRELENLWLARDGHYLDAVSPAIEGVHLDVRPSADKRVPSSWRVSGLDALDEHRVLVAAHLLVIEPWASGEDRSVSRYGN